MSKKTPELRITAFSRVTGVFSSQKASYTECFPGHDVPNINPHRAELQPSGWTHENTMPFTCDIIVVQPVKGISNNTKLLYFIAWSEFTFSSWLR